MTFEVTRPSDGTVKVELNWAEAEVLLRLIDVVNYGSIKTLSPTLTELGDALRAQFGHNDSNNCTNVYSNVSGSQVQLFEKYPF